MIKSKQDLEKKVLEYDPVIRERVQRDPEALSKLERIADEEYTRYRPYLKGAANTAGKLGRGLGYVGDAVFWGSAIAAATNPILAPYMLTGLLLKKFHAAAQAPEAVKTINYMKNTGDVVGGTRNIGAKVLSYLPGATILDRGLGKISEKRLLKQATYKTREALGVESIPWHTYTAEALQKSGRYTGVRDRKNNVVRVYGGKAGPVLAEVTPEGNLKVDFRKKDVKELPKRKVA